MIAQDLITELFFPLNITDNGYYAADIMENWKVSYLPLVNGNEYLGVISETDIFTMEDMTLSVGNKTFGLNRPYVSSGSHAFEVVETALKYLVPIIPVLDAESHYSGTIVLREAVKKMSDFPLFAMPGGILVLEMACRDYSLSQIAQIVESNNVKVLGLFVSHSEEGKIEVTVKVNTYNIISVVKTFERYNYNVRTWPANIDSVDSFYMERYNNLMSYLNV